jgi:O-antigen ligase
MNNTGNVKKFWLIGGALVLVLALMFSFSYWTVMALVLGLLLVILLFSVYPEWGLYLLAFSCPLINWSFTVGSFNASFPEIVALLLSVSFILRQGSFFLKGEKESARVVLPFWQPFLVFMVVLGLSSLYSSYITASVWYSVRWVLFLYVSYLVVPYNIMKNGKILKRTIIALVLSGLGVAIMGLVSLGYQDWYNDFFRVQPMAIGGLYVIGSNHNLIAEFLVIITFLVLSLKHWSKSFRLNRFLDVLFILLLATTVGTFSRTGWIVLGLEVLVYFFLDTFILRRRTWHFRTIILAILVSMIVLTPFAYRMSRLQERNTSSTENRVLLTTIAWKAFLAKPLLGYGPGTFVSLVSDNVRFTAKYGDPLDSHGVWQKVLAETGALGTISFAVFVGMMFWRLYGGLRKYISDSKLLLPLLVAVMGGFVYQWFNTSYYKSKFWLPLAVALAAVNLLERKYMKKRKIENN